MPLDSSLDNITELPYTISFVIRKRIQIDNFNELPRDKRPPEKMIWEGTTEEIEDWLDRVVRNKKEPSEFAVMISDRDIEG